MSEYDYKPTPALSDEDGLALLNELNNLFGTIERDDSGKKVRFNSSAQRFAIAELQRALIKAASRFEHHEEFTAWLCRNNEHHLEAYDPIRGRSKQADAIRDLQWQMERIEHQVRGLERLIRMIVDERVTKKQETV
jgi:hypothetical protein